MNRNDKNGGQNKGTNLREGLKKMSKTDEDSAAALLSDACEAPPFKVRCNSCEKKKMQVDCRNVPFMHKAGRGNLSSFCVCVIHMASISIQMLNFANKAGS